MDAEAFIFSSGTRMSLKDEIGIKGDTKYWGYKDLKAGSRYRTNKSSRDFRDKPNNAAALYSIENSWKTTDEPEANGEVVGVTRPLW